MKIVLVMLTVLLVVLNATAEEEGWFKYEYPGYEDTPLIPGSEFRVHQQDRPQPSRVIPPETCETACAPPSDAIVLFNGASLEQFEETSWEIADGILIAGHGSLYTKEAYGDCQLHVEWRTPNPPEGEPANMGNSGIFFMGFYELQIYDSYSSKIYADGSAAAMYAQTPPLVNVCRKPGEWQSFDIVFTAPVFENEKLVEPGWITVLHNGVLVHHHTQILGPTVHRAFEPYKPHAAVLPLMIQGHGSPVAFRNIWIRRL
jgi:hypothetical protein